MEFLDYEVLSAHPTRGLGVSLSKEQCNRMAIFFGRLILVSCCDHNHVRHTFDVSPASIRYVHLLASYVCSTCLYTKNELYESTLKVKTSPDDINQQDLIFVSFSSLVLEMRDCLTHVHRPKFGLYSVLLLVFDCTLWTIYG